MSSQSEEDLGATREMPDTILPLGSQAESLEGSDSHASTRGNSTTVSTSDTSAQAEQGRQSESGTGSSAPKAVPVDAKDTADGPQSERSQSETSTKEAKQVLDIDHAVEDEANALEQSPKMATAIADQGSASGKVKASRVEEEEVIAIDLTDDAPALAFTATELDMTGVEPVVDAALGPESSGTPVSTVEMETVAMPVQEIIDLTMSEDDDDQEPVTTIIKAHVPVVKKESGEEDNQVATLSSFHQYGEDHATGTDVGLVAPQPDVGEAEDQAEMLRIALSNFNKSSSQGDRNGEGSANLEHRQDTSHMPDFDSDVEDARLTEKFSSLKRRYQNKKRSNKLTEEDEIDYSRACNAEEERKQLRSNRCAYQYRDAQDNSMFIPEEASTPSPSVIDLSDEFGDEITLAVPSNQDMLQDFFANDDEPKSKTISKAGKGRGRGRPRKETAGREKVTRDGVAKPSATRGRGAGRGSRGGGKRKGDYELANINELFRDNNMFEDARANLEKRDQPVLGASRDKKKALQALIASIPADQRDLYVGEKVDLEKATRSFTAGTMRSDGHGGFMLKGMKSSLKHFQVLGSRFCRERENSKTRPFGGIMGHEMGLGKTVMMIANILDGRQLSSNKPRATLIVVPPSLISQWVYEIQKHKSEGVLQDVLLYRPGNKPMSLDPVRTLSNTDIVVTSYNEVMRSWPVNSPPAWLVTEQAKREWWDRTFRAERGVLHRVRWHRVVLDEAQAIKNYESKTSEAVCNLEAKYRWAISGTPVQNRLEEFYPYFRFLRCDHTGTFELFKRNFCKRGSAAATQRLQVVLSKIMIRKTHKDEMFGAPILKLPKIHPVETIEVEFNIVERAIYQIIRQRFWQKLKVFRTKDGIEKHYRTVFVLLLRLRQLVSSPLLIQSTLKTLLETEDLERLWQITATSSEQTVDESARDTIIGLRAALDTVNADDPSMSSRRSSRDTNGSIGSNGPVAEPTLDSPGSAAFKFRKYLQALHDAGQWEEANSRSVCHMCKEPPTNPHITACMHIYCLPCIRDLQYNATLTSSTANPDDATCIACGSRFKKSEAFAAQGFDQASDRNATPYSVRSDLRGRRRKSADKDEEDIDWFTIGGPVLQSAKTKGAVKKMEEWWAADKKAKIIIFVQFTAMIKIFSRICKEKDWGFTFFHGGTTFTGRDDAIARFSNDDDCKVLIASLKSGGVGLNLVAANRVIIIDLWWNQSVETQAFCRVFRIGQTREVEVARFVVKDSIDMDILQMQERKTAEVESAMEESNRPTRLTTAELLKLFGPSSKDVDGPAAGEGVDEDEGFIMVDDPYERLGDDDVAMTGA